MAGLRLLLYVSYLAEASGQPDVAAIVRESWKNSERDDVSGLLVFDGSRFAQFLEGPEAAMQHLRSRLEGDHRHRDIEVLVWSTGVDCRRFASWRMGYLKYDLDRWGLQGLRGARGDVAIERSRSFCRRWTSTPGELIPFECSFAG